MKEFMVSMQDNINKNIDKQVVELKQDIAEIKTQFEKYNRQLMEVQTRRSGVKDYKYRKPKGRSRLI